jgi:hypothetical protein
MMNGQKIHFIIQEGMIDGLKSKNREVKAQ